MYDERELLSRQEGCLPNDMLEVSPNCVVFDIAYDVCAQLFFS